MSDQKHPTMPPKQITTRNVISVEKRAQTCVSCKQRPRTIMFLPCSHQITCSSCADVMENCASCGRTILGTYNVSWPNRARGRSTEWQQRLDWLDHDESFYQNKCETCNVCLDVTNWHVRIQAQKCSNVYLFTLTRTHIFANFRGNPLLSSLKTTLKQQINGQKTIKNERKRLILYWLSFEGEGGRKEREREKEKERERSRAELWNTDSCERKKKRKKKKGKKKNNKKTTTTCFGSDLGKGRFVLER